MSTRERRLDPLEPVFRERKRREEGGARGHRMNRGAYVVEMPGKGQLGPPQPTAGSRSGLDHEHVQSLAHEHDCRGEPVGPCSHHDCVPAGSLVHLSPAMDPWPRHLFPVDQSYRGPSKRVAGRAWLDPVN